MSDEPEHAQPDPPDPPTTQAAPPVVRIVLIDKHLLTVDGADRIVPPGGDVEDEAEAAAAETARARGGPVDAVLSTPDGAWTWRLRVHPDGRVEEILAPVPPRRRPRWPVVALAVLLVFAAAVTWMRSSQAPPPKAAAAQWVGSATPATAASPTALPTASPAPAGCAKDARTVADVIDPKQWYLTLPTGHPGHPDEIPPAQLGDVDDPAAHLDHGGLLFTVRADGVTTAHSDYPRAELRELTPAGKHAAWSPKTGSHTLTVCQAVTALPPAKPQLVTAQIHDAKSDVMEVRLEGARLIAKAGDGKYKLTLDKAYRLGTPYQLRITAAAGQISVAYNGKTAGSMPATGSGWYFKTGAYLQSNTDHGDAPDVTGAVRLYSATVNHSAAAPSTPPAPTGAARESSQLYAAA